MYWVDLSIKLLGSYVIYGAWSFWALYKYWEGIFHRLWIIRPNTEVHNLFKCLGNNTKHGSQKEENFLVKNYHENLFVMAARRPGFVPPWHNVAICWEGINETAKIRMNGLLQRFEMDAYVMRGTPFQHTLNYINSIIIYPVLFISLCLWYIEKHFTVFKLIFLLLLTAKIFLSLALLPN